MMERKTLLLSKISDFYKKSLSLLKKQVFPAILPNDPKYFQKKLEREKYLNFFFLIIILYSTNVFDFCIGIMRIDVFLATTIATGIFIHQLLRGKIKHIHLLFPLVAIFLPFIWTFIESKIETMLIAQIILSLSPAINMVLSRSAPSSLALYGLNIAQSLLILKPKIHQALAFEEDDPRYMMISLYISKSFGFGLCILGAFWSLHDSRAHLIFKLFEKQKEQEILNNKLQEKNIQLEEIAQSKADIFLNVSHELRNPLNIVSGFAELALIDKPNENTIPYLNNIHSGTKLLLFLINNFLDAYKMDHQELELFNDNVKTFDFIKKIWNSTKMLIMKKNLYGHLFISKNMPEYMEIDEMRVTQIIYNLVGNATKFTTQGYVSIVFTWIESESIDSMMKQPTEESYFREFISREIPKRYKIFDKKETNQEDNEISSIKRNLDDNLELPIIEESTIFRKHKTTFFHCAKSFSYIKLFSGYYDVNLDQIDFPSYQPTLKKPSRPSPNTERKGHLKIEIIDSGCGIHPDQFKDLFKKFGQVGGSQKRFGTGLGLWISKTMCVKMQGSLEFFSESDKGSVFVALIKSI